MNYQGTEAPHFECMNDCYRKWCFRTNTIHSPREGIEETTSGKVDRSTILNELYDSTHTVSPARQRSPETLQWSTPEKKVSERAHPSSCENQQKTSTRNPRFLRGSPDLESELPEPSSAAGGTPEIRTPSSLPVEQNVSTHGKGRIWCLRNCIDRNLIGTFLSILQKEMSGRRRLSK